MNAEDALGCKCLAKEIKNYSHDTWKKEAKVHCEEGIKAKFYQNNDLHDYLINTGNKKIVECCSDKLWGNGVPLHEEDCLQPLKWSQQGLLGEILVDIRANITDIMGINSSKSSTVSVSEPVTMDTANCT